MKFTLGMGVAALGVMLFLVFSGIIGSEFLPHLDEGAIWVRGTLAPEHRPDDGHRGRQARPASYSPDFPK